MHAASTLARYAFVLFTSTLSLSAQRTIVVQGGGPALQVAVLQASPGDILLVRSATYSAVSVDKGLTVRCDPGVVVFGAGQGTALSVDVPAGQLLQWTGGTAGGSLVVPIFQAGGAGLALFTDFACRARCTVDGRQVGFQRCDLGTLSVRSGSHATSAALSGCMVRSGLAVESAVVTVTGGWITGSTASVSGDPGIRMRGPSEVTLAADLTVIAFAGFGFAVPAIEAQGGTVVLAPTVQLQHSASAPVIGASQVIPRWLPAVTSGTAAAGQSFRTSVFAEPASLAVLLLSLPSPPVTVPFGALWIGTDNVTLDSGTVPQGGVRQSSRNLPAGLPQHLPVVMQAVGVLTNGELWVGPPTAEVLN